MQLGSVTGIASAMRSESDRLANSAQRVAQETSRNDAAIDRVSVGSAPPAAISGYGRAATLSSSAEGSARGGDVDLAAEQVTQLSSLRAFQANVAVLRTADEMLGTLVTQRG